jgi:hypothetical protein
MRKFVLLAALLVFGATLSAQSLVITVNDALSFDYRDDYMADYAVQRFEVTWDCNPATTQCTFQTLNTTQFRDALTQDGHSSYRYVPPFSNGNHTVALRACNAWGCGGSSTPFPFAYENVSPPPGVPTNFRKVPRQ